MELIGEPYVALLLGALVCLAVAPGDMWIEMVAPATRRTGVILLDLCRAGSFGNVMAQSGLGEVLFSSLEAAPRSS